jgi:hypothetical protein
MDKSKKKLMDIFNDDPLGLLEIKTKSPARSTDDRLIYSYQEINDIFENNKREPEPGNSIQERALYDRLKGIRENREKTDRLAAHDKYRLLNKPTAKEVKSIEDILNSDAFGILDDSTEGLFDLKHIPKQNDRESADYIANRKPCKDFKKYDSLFKIVQSDLSKGKRELIRFSELNLKEGNFYVHNGILLYLECVNFEIATQEYKSGSRIRKDGRTRCIFENGTESNMLYRSLYKVLLDNGKAVTQTKEEIAEEFRKKTGHISDDDEETGFIYVLKSKSNAPQIKNVESLYKIGYTNIPIEERIKNAQQDPTYLMAPVKIVTTFLCYNLNPQKLELLLHTFFGNSCLNIDIFDNNGKRHTPREWFIAPLDVIEQAIEYIISGEIVWSAPFTMDAIQKCLV